MIQGEESSSQYAEEGSLAHEIAELKLRKYCIEPMGARTFNARIKKFKENPLFQEEMLKHTDTYLDYIAGVLHGFSSSPYVAAINAAIQEGVTSRWNEVRPTVLAIPVYDGDGVRPSDGMPFGEECKGHWVFTASSKLAPEIVDLAMKRILNQAEIYSGIHARVSVSFFPYASNGKKGIGCGLGPVQKIEDGEPLEGRVSAAEAFSNNGGGYSPIQVQTLLSTKQSTIYPQ